MSDSEDYDRTWLQRPLTGSSPPPGDRQAGEDPDSNALPEGTKIDEFEVVDLIGIGGFGIVYLAHDHSLGRLVALKEYMPASLAARVEGLTVAVKSARLAQTFAIGLRSFVNEARLLAQFDHPALVKVFRFWEGNGTAYMVMPFYEGVTLKQALQRMPGPPDEAWLRGVIDPLLDALEVLHRANCFHRDIAPDNILLLTDGRPLLLDFGAARRVISDRTQALTVILKPGYAPLEQYAEVPHVKQGAWTDIYALAAVVYNAITGRPPMPSVGRSINDTLVPLTKAAAGRYRQSFLSALDRALAVKPEDRPQTIAEFRALLALEEVPSTKPAAESAKATAEAKATATPKAPEGHGAGSRTALLVGAAGAILIVAGGVLYALRAKPVEPPSPAVTVAAPAVPPVVAPPVTPSTAAQASPAGADSPATPAAQVQTADGKSLAEDQLVETLLGKDGAIGGAQKAVKPFDPVDMLQQIYQQRDPDRQVTAVPEKAKVKINRDRLSFRVNSLYPGYVYLLMVGSDGNINMLFPNALDADNGIGGDGELRLPRPGWAMTAGGPPGTDHFVVIVSENRRDFKAAGLKKGTTFDEFPRQAAEKIAQHVAKGAPIPFAGKAVCPASGKCSSRYGAAIFSIEEIE